MEIYDFCRCRWHPGSETLEELQPLHSEVSLQDGRAQTGKRGGGGGRWSSSNGRGSRGAALGAAPRPQWELGQSQEYLHSELAMTPLGKAGRAPADTHPVRGDPWGIGSSSNRLSLSAHHQPCTELGTDGGGGR